MADSRSGDSVCFTLYGFSDFLEGKTVRFTGSHPAGNVCVSCGGLHCSIKLSRCLHAFCLNCSEEILTTGDYCPVDGQLVSFSSLIGSRLEESGMAEYTVRCLNALHGCPFEGSWADLEQHVLQRCPHNLVACGKCGEQIPSSNLEDHRMECQAPSVAVGSSGDSGEKKRQKDIVVAQIDGSACGSEGAPEPHGVAAYSSAMDQTTFKKPLCPPPLAAGVVPPGHQRPPKMRKRHPAENLKSKLSVLASAPPSESSSVRTYGTDRSSPTKRKSQSEDASEVSQKKKSPVRPTTLALGPRRTPKLTAAELNATMANTALMLRPTNRKTSRFDLLGSLSDALKNIMGGPSDVSVTLQAKTDEGGRQLAEEVGVAKRSDERSTVTSQQSLNQVETDEDPRRDELSVQLDAPSAEGNEDSSERSAAMGSSQNFRAVKVSTAAILDGGSDLSDMNIDQEAPGAVGGDRLYEGVGLKAKLQEMLRYRRSTFIFSGLEAVGSALETETTVTVASESDALCGYTFQVACRFRGLGGLIMVSFGLSFCSGKYDNTSRWPFRMTVFFEVLHPRKEPRYMKVELRPLRAVPPGAYSKPEPGKANPAVFSREYAWVNVVKAGLVANGTLCLQVWFE